MLHKMNVFLCKFKNSVQKLIEITRYFYLIKIKKEMTEEKVMRIGYVNEFKYNRFKATTKKNVFPLLWVRVIKKSYTIFLGVIG